MLKLLIMPPFNQSHHQWAKEIQQQLPVYQIVMPETMQLAQAELAQSESSDSMLKCRAIETPFFSLGVNCGEPFLVAEFGPAGGLVAINEN